MSQSNSVIENAYNDKKRFVCNKGSDLNRIYLYVAGDNIVYKNLYIENKVNIENSSRIYTIDKTLNIESNKIIVSGNVCLTGASLGFSGNLSVSCNGILSVSGISFCDNSLISNGTTYSFDLKTDKVLTLQTDIEKIIVVKNRIYQDLSTGSNYGNYTGYYEIAKNSFPAVSNAYSNKAVIESTTRTTNNNVWFSICWSPELSLFVGVAVSGTNNRVMTSNDGINWTLRVSPANNEWRSVVWAKELNLFVAVSITGIGNRIMTSNDGINWVSRVSPADIEWRSVVWAKELNLFVAVGYSVSENNGIMTSNNGIDWTLRLSPNNYVWNSVCWSPELNLLVAVSLTGIGNRVMTSPDGINWTLRVSPVDNNWRYICWSPELRIFVAVAESGTGDRVMTSPDGINWTLRVSPADNNWTSVCWSPDLNLFFAVAYSGIGNRIMTSPDGINWTLRVSPVDNNWRYICWSSELKLFVAVANSGNNNRVMTSSFKARPPTSYNFFDSSINTIDQGGNWTIQQTLKRGTYISNDTTPSVLGANLLYITNSSPNTLITNFTNPNVNQEIVLVFFDSNTTIENNANIRLRGGVNFTSTSNDTLTLLYTGTLWVEISRSINP